MSEKAHVFLNWQTQIHRLFHTSRLPFDLVRLIWLFFFSFFFLITQSSQCNCPPTPLYKPRRAQIITQALPKTETVLPYGQHAPGLLTKIRVVLGSSRGNNLWHLCFFQVYKNKFQEGTPPSLQTKKGTQISASSPDESSSFWSLYLVSQLSTTWGTCVFSVSKQVEPHITLTFSIDIAQFIITDFRATCAEIETFAKLILKISILPNSTIFNPM